MCIKFQINRSKPVAFTKIFSIEKFLGGRGTNSSKKENVNFSLKIEYFYKPYIPLKSPFQDLSNGIITFYYTF